MRHALRLGLLKCSHGPGRCDAMSWQAPSGRRYTLFEDPEMDPKQDDPYEQDDVEWVIEPPCHPDRERDDRMSTPKWWSYR